MAGFEIRSDLDHPTGQLRSSLEGAMRRSQRVAAARAAQGQDMPIDSHFGQLPVELQERIIEIVVRCGAGLCLSSWRAARYARAWPVL